MAEETYGNTPFAAYGPGSCAPFPLLDHQYLVLPGHGDIPLKHHLGQ